MDKTIYIVIVAVSIIVMIFTFIEFKKIHSELNNLKINNEKDNKKLLKEIVSENKQNIDKYIKINSLNFDKIKKIYKLNDNKNQDCDLYLEQNSNSPNDNSYISPYSNLTNPVKNDNVNKKSKESKLLNNIINKNNIVNEKDKPINPIGKFKQQFSNVAGGMLDLIIDAVNDYDDKNIVIDKKDIIIEDDNENINDNIYVNNNYDNFDNKIDKSNDDIINNPIDKQDDNIINNPIDNPIDEFINNPIDKSNNNIIDNSIDKPIDDFVDNPIDKLNNNIIDNLIDKPIDNSNNDKNNIINIIDNINDNINDVVNKKPTDIYSENNNLDNFLKTESNDEENIEALYITKNNKPVEEKKSKVIKNDDKIQKPVKHNKKLTTNQINTIKKFLETPVDDCRLVDMIELCKKLKIKTFLWIDGKTKTLKKNEIYEKLKSYIN